MKTPISLCAVFAASLCMLQAETSSPEAALAGIQDDRLADVEAVQEAIKTAAPAERAAILAAFRQRDEARAAQAGAASQELQLARQAEVKARKAFQAGQPPQPAPTAK